MNPKDAIAKLARIGFPFTAPSWPANVERPSKQRHIGLEYDHDWSRKYLVRLARAVVIDNVTRPVVQLAAPTTTRGTEYLTNLEGPFIFASNHASHIDTPILLTSLPVHIRHRIVVAAAADYFFDRTWKSALWSFSLPAIPLERTKISRRSFDMAAELIEDGWNLLIFPEGGRTQDGWFQPFRGSAAYLSKRTKRPVVPVYIHGSHNVLPRKSKSSTTPPGGSGTENLGGKRFHRTPISVLFSNPILPEENESVRRFAVRIEQAVATLAYEAETDWWGARRSAALDEVPPAGGPPVSAWRRSWALGPRESIDQRPGRKRWPLS